MLDFKIKPILDKDIYKKRKDLTMDIEVPRAFAGSTPPTGIDIPIFPVRFPYAKEKTIETWILPTIASDLAFRLAEVIPKVALQAVTNIRESLTEGKATPLKVPFDLRRLGVTDPYVYSSGTKLLSEFQKQQEKNPPKSDWDLWKNALISSTKTVIPDAFDAVIAGDMLNLGARVVLKATAYDPILDRTLIEIGLPKKGFTLGDFKKNFSQTLLKKSQEGNKQGVIDALRAGKYIIDKYRGEGIPTLTKFGEAMQNLAKKLSVEDVFGRDFMYRPIFAPTGLPGYKPEPGLSFGMSIKKLQRIGGGEELIKMAKASKSLETLSKELTTKGLLKQATGMLAKAGFKDLSSFYSAVSPKIVPEAPEGVLEAIKPEKGIIPKEAEEFVKAQGTPKTIRVWIKSKFSDKGAYTDFPVIRKEKNITLYQGGKVDENRQFWTPNKKYAEQFGEVKKKTGTFYKVDTGNRVADVYVGAPTKQQLTDIFNQSKAVGEVKPLAQEARKGVADEFKIGDMLDPQGKTNMVGKVTIREIKGNTLKFVDSAGTKFAGMQRSIVRDLVKKGSWKKEVASTISPLPQQEFDITQAVKGVKEVPKPEIKPAEELSAKEQKIYKAEVMKEMIPEIKNVERQLFRDIKEIGGIKSYKGKFLSEELRPVPLSLKNNKTGIPMDEMTESLREKGYNFDSDSDLLEAILKISRSKARGESLVERAKTIVKKMPKKTTKVSRRLLNKLYRLKYPKIPAGEKAVRRAIEAGKISSEFEGKTISEIRKIKGFVEPKSVPIERLNNFDNFINLNKIARKNIPYKRLGIAEIIRGDKTFPAIRKSGFFAIKEIQTAPIKDIYKQTFAPYHAALAQDGYRLGGKFGIMFKNVWKPTEKAIRNEKEFTNVCFKTIKDIGNKYKIKATKENLEHLSDVIENKVKATPNEELFIKEASKNSTNKDIRNVLDNLREQANKIRRVMSKKEIGYITDYIPHIQKTTLWNELLSNVATISDNLDFIIPNAVRNPFAYKRMLEELPKAERNLYILLDRYIRAISKDIYITPAIENIKAYNSVLKNRELFNASKYWDEYIRYGLIGKQYKIDTSLSIGQTGGKISQKWNNMVNLAFLTGKVAWNTATQPLSYIMNVPMEAGIRNSLIAIRKSFNKSLRQYVKENSNVLAIKSGDVRAVAIGEGRNIQNRIYQTKIDKWNDFISMIGSVEERELTRTSYIAGLERAKNLGYKGQDALDFADLTAARTQSMYNRENRALILDSDIARTIFPFQSFSVEMFNHSKEILTKSSGAMQLSYRQRIGKLFRLLVGIALSTWYTKKLTGRRKTTIGTFVPFLGNYVDMLIAKAFGKQYYGGRSPITIIQIGEDVIRGSKDFIRHGNLKRLRKVGINFGLALGGIGGGGQINNVIDGIMADMDEEVRNVKGNTMFEVKDSLSKVIAPFFGVWATKEGREYWLPKKEAGVGVSPAKTKGEGAFPKFEGFAPTKKVKEVPFQNLKDFSK